MADPYAQIDAALVGKVPYGVILPKIAQLAAMHGVDYKTFQQYLENKYIELIIGKSAVEQSSILEKLGLPLVYINQLRAKAAAPQINAEAAEAAAALVNVSQAQHAAAALAAAKGSNKGGRRKRSTKRRRRNRRSHRK